MARLLDTNVLSELQRPRPEPKVVAFVDDCALGSLYISVVTAAETRFGIELVTQPNRRAELNQWLIHKVRPQPDLIIAATAIEHDLTALPAIAAATTRRGFPCLTPGRR
jgi:predicted nucleic acid-binding protein